MAFSFAGVLSGIDKMQAKALKAKEITDAREQSLLGIYLSKLETQATSRTGDKYTNAATASLKLQKRVSNADLDEESQAFYNNIISDPFAAKEVLTFIDNNVLDNGVPIPLSDVRNMINIIGSKLPEEEKKDYLSTITGSDLADDSTYYKIAKELSLISAAPGRTVITDVKPEASVLPKVQEELFERQMNVINGNLLGKAKAFVKANLNSTDQNIQTQVRETQAAIQLAISGNKESMQAGNSSLMEVYLTPENFREDFVENHPGLFKGWEKNYYLPLSIKSIKPAEVTNDSSNNNIIPNAIVLTQAQIDANPQLQNVGAQPGDQFLNTDGGGMLYGPDGKPK